MAFFYSRLTRGFYDSNDAGALPDDAKEVPSEMLSHLFEGQAAGMQIVPGDDGLPVLADQPGQVPLTLGLTIAIRRAVYQREADPLKMEAEYDAIMSGTPPDYTAWLAKVAEVKERFPLPAE